MATRSRIGIKVGDHILSAYHHWDGYAEWLGRALKAQYNDYAKALTLVEGGDMSSCWTDERWDDSANGTKGPQYYSQRGDISPPRKDTGLLSYLKDGEEYAYLYVQDIGWICFYMNQFDDEKDPEIIPIPEPTEEFN